MYTNNTCQFCYSPCGEPHCPYTKESQERDSQLQGCKNEDPSLHPIPEPEL